MLKCTFLLNHKLGDASSPHGSNCLQINGNGVGGDGSKSSSPSLSTANCNEPLSRQQLDVISQIIQHTKPSVCFTTANQQNGQKSLSRPRTWNIQVRDDVCTGESLYYNSIHCSDYLSTLTNIQNCSKRIGKKEEL